MRLLLDKNISFRIRQLISDLYPDSTSVEEVELYAASDEEIWNYAAGGSFVLVTKDSDFRQRSFARGVPPKVIWIATGNCPTETIVSLSLLRKRKDAIELFAADPDAALFVLR